MKWPSELTLRPPVAWEGGGGGPPGGGVGVGGRGRGVAGRGEGWAEGGEEVGSRNDAGGDGAAPAELDHGLALILEVLESNVVLLPGDHVDGVGVGVDRVDGLGLVAPVIHQRRL